MTVCIAAMYALRQGGPSVIVTTNDLMLSNDTGSLDHGAIKSAALVFGDEKQSGPWARWFSLYAGDPTTFALLVEHIQNALGSEGYDRRWSCFEVMAAAEDAYDDVIQRRIEREVLVQQFKMNLAEFKKMAAESQGSALVDHITEQIAEAKARITLEMHYTSPTHLLVCGFDADGLPHIFSTDGIGRCTLHDSMTFHAVGAGADAALGWLRVNPDFRFVGNVYEMAYRLSEAKFIAENSPFVGKSSVLNMWFSTEVMTTLIVFPPPATAPIRVLREAWEARLNLPIHADAIAEIGRQMHSMAKIQGVRLPMSDKGKLTRETDEPTPPAKE